MYAQLYQLPILAENETCIPRSMISFPGMIEIHIKIRLLLTKLTLLHWQDIPNMVLTLAYN